MPDIYLEWMKEGIAESITDAIHQLLEIKTPVSKSRCKLPRIE
jgi:hypothetical protein